MQLFGVQLFCKNLFSFESFFKVFVLAWQCKFFKLFTHRNIPVLFILNQGSLEFTTKISNWGLKPGCDKWNWAFWLILKEKLEKNSLYNFTQRPWRQHHKFYTIFYTINFLFTQFGKNIVQRDLNNYCTIFSCLKRKKVCTSMLGSSHKNSQWFNPLSVKKLFLL